MAELALLQETLWSLRKPLFTIVVGRLSLPGLSRLCSQVLETMRKDGYRIAMIADGDSA